MIFCSELEKAFSQLQDMLIENQSTDLLTMPYAEFTLTCYAGYHLKIYSDILSKDFPLERALRSIGIDTPRDQLMILLDTFYLHLHACMN